MVVKVLKRVVSSWKLPRAALEAEEAATTAADEPPRPRRAGGDLA